MGIRFTISDTESAEVSQRQVELVGHGQRIVQVGERVFGPVGVGVTDDTNVVIACEFPER